MQEEWKLVFYAFEIAAIFLDLGLGLLLARRTAMTGRGYMRKYYYGATGLFIAHGFYMLTSVIYDLMGIEYIFGIGVFLVLSSIVMLVWAIESAMYTRSRYAFTIAGCVALGIILVDVFGQFQFPIMRLRIWVQVFINPVLVAFILLNYLIAARRVTGPTRRNVLLMFFSIALLSVAELSKFPLANQLPEVELIGAITMDAAIIMLYFGIMRLSVWKKEPREPAGKAGNPSGVEPGPVGKQTNPNPPPHMS